MGKATGCNAGAIILGEKLLVFDALGTPAAKPLAFFVDSHWVTMYSAIKCLKTQRFFSTAETAN
ncbi:hypothetical protein [Planococcus sp. YIM B11945]|uniref:hypothetical protein n=1 Tax=Planococcus sp. YIM B11945 TaxID=3435410 RepID=UPI003D7E01A6